jgi:hypothetical protein
VIIGTIAGVTVCSSLISAVSRVYGLGAGLGRPPAIGTLAAAVVLAVGAAALAGLGTTRAADREPAAVVLGP